MKRYKAVLFDLCGTVMQYRIDRMPLAVINGESILTTTPLLHACFKKYNDVKISFEKFHADFIETTEAVARLRESKGEEVLSATRFKMFLDRLGVHPGADREILQRRLKSLHLDRVAKCLELLPHDRALLNIWRKHYQIGLVTNFDDTETVYKVLKRDNIDGFFEAISISAELGIRKPRREIFLTASEKLNVSPEETLFVGDSWESDVVGAKEAGMDAAWIHPEQPLLLENGMMADYQIANLGGLSSIL